MVPVRFKEFGARINVPIQVKDMAVVPRKDDCVVIAGEKGFRIVRQVVFDLHVGDVTVFVTGEMRA